MYFMNLHTRSLAVGAITDRTAYDARYAGKLSNRFLLHVYERLVPRIHDPIQPVEFMNAPKHYLFKRDN